MPLVLSLYKLRFGTQVPVAKTNKNVNNFSHGVN